MITYAVCDQDGFVSLSVEGDIAHYAANPTHTSHIGVGGDSSSPIPYSTGSSTIPEVTSDPVSPTAGQTWVLHTGGITTSGTPLGLLLSLTHDVTSANVYQLSYRTTENTTIRVGMS